MRAKFIFSLLLAVGFSVSAQTNRVVSSYNSFGFKLLVETRKANPGKNVFLSPPGAAFALSMVGDGARGDTLRQIKNVLQLDDTVDFNAANQSLLEGNLGPKIKLEMANALWSDIVLKQDFLKRLRNSYHAEVATANFQDPSTVKQINDWVNDQTHGKIKDIVQPPLDTQLHLILLNAIYFKGEWAAPFDPKLTHDLPFTLADGRQIIHPRMSRTGRFEYYESDAFQEVRLPYAGDEATLYVLLPKNGIDFLLQNIPPGWMDLPRSQKGSLEMPRFKINNSYDLKDILVAMGMPLAFSDKADFSGMADQRLHIGWVKQKTFVEVNEQGTEAAAVTGVGMVGMAVHREPPPFHMVVDRPFLVALRENKTGLILFLGAIVDPRSHE